MCLVGVASLVGLGVCSAAGSVAGSGVGSRVGLLSKFPIRNSLLLKLLRTFSLELNNNPSYLKNIFPSAFYLFQNSLILYFAYDQHFLITNVPHVVLGQFFLPPRKIALLPDNYPSDNCPLDDCPQDNFSQG